MSLMRQIAATHAGAGKERRRADRVMIRIPVRVQALAPDGAPMNADGESLVVSRAGALLQTRTPLPTGTTIVVTNTLSRHAERFRVVWSGAQQNTGRYDIGVEQMAEHDSFWGVRFPPTTRR